MANTIELLRTTYNALIVEQWLREGNREETMRYIYIYIYLKKSRTDVQDGNLDKAQSVQFEEKGKPIPSNRLCP